MRARYIAALLDKSTVEDGVPEPLVVNTTHSLLAAACGLLKNVGDTAPSVLKVGVNPALSVAMITP